MFSFLFLVLFLTEVHGADKHARQGVKREDANNAFGYTNFNIKLKDKIKRPKNKVLEENIISDKLLKGGPYQIQPWRDIKIPMPLILNERIRNPKFISKNPKRKQKKEKNKAIVNKKPLNFSQSIPPHANILNTNFKFAFLARKKNIYKTRDPKRKKLQEIERMNNLDVRKGLRMRKGILRKRKKKII